MKGGDFVLVQLVNPREKFWGILKERDGPASSCAA